MHFAALHDHAPVLEVLSQHAPATLEMKNNVRLSVFVCILPHAGGGEAVRMDTAPLCSTLQSPLCCEVDHQPGALPGAGAEQPWYVSWGVLRTSDGCG
jgi:hypothetical protein